MYHVVLTEKKRRESLSSATGWPVILDIGMPRDVEPAVRRLTEFSYDLEGLEREVKNDAADRSAAAAEAEKIIAGRGRGQPRPTAGGGCSANSAAAWHCGNASTKFAQLDSFIGGRRRPYREQDQSLHAITAQVIQKIASSLARELKDVPEKQEQGADDRHDSACFTWTRRKPSLPAPNQRRKNHRAKQTHTIAANF